MKMRTSLSLFFALFFASISHAQSDEMIEAMGETPDLSITTQQVKWQKQQHTAHVMSFHAEAKDVEKAAEDFFEDKYAISFSNLKGFQAAEGVVLSDIMVELVTLGFRVESSGNTSRLEVIVITGSGSVSTSNHPTASSSLHRVMGTFGREFYQKAYLEVLKDQEKSVEKEEKALAKINKDGVKLQEDLDKNTEGIAKAEADIAQKQKEIEELQAEIEAKKKEIENLNKELETNATEKAKQEEVVTVKQALLNKLKQASEAINR